MRLFYPDIGFVCCACPTLFRELNCSVAATENYGDIESINRIAAFWQELFSYPDPLYSLASHCQVNKEGLGYENLLHNILQGRIYIYVCLPACLSVWSSGQAVKSTQREHSSCSMVRATGQLSFVLTVLTTERYFVPQAKVLWLTYRWILR